MTDEEEGYPRGADAMSARSLVLGMVRNDATIHAGELYDVADAAGFTYHQIRLCLARLVDEGLFTQAGRGRKAIFSATAKGRSQLEPELEFLALAFDQDAGLAPWDGNWHLVAFTIGEDRRQARNALRELLVTRGAPLGGGLYVTAHDWDHRIVAEAKNLEVDGDVVVAVAGQLRVENETDPASVAAIIWDLDLISRRWKRFLREQRSVVRRMEKLSAGPVDRVQVLADLVAFSAAFEFCIREDPLLPPELLPTNWPGQAARDLLLAADLALAPLRDVEGLPEVFGRYDEVFEAAHDHRR